ncbi:MAG: hypothetical protein R2880_20120, partial [Deinococcales bacterium]
MGRKSLAEERIEQILDAFEVTIIEYGLENSSLERIAQVAQVKRPIIHHYIGNWDDLLKALVKRTMIREELAMRERLSELSENSMLPELLDLLFPPKIAEDEAQTS